MDGNSNFHNNVALEYGGENGHGTSSGSTMLFEIGIVELYFKNEPCSFDDRNRLGPGRRHSATYIYPEMFQ